MDDIASLQQTLRRCTAALVVPIALVAVVYFQVLAANGFKNDIIYYNYLYALAVLSLVVALTYLGVSMVSRLGPSATTQ